MTAQPVPNPRKSRENEVLTLEEVSDLLRVPIATLRYWRVGGGGPKSFKIGRHVRYFRTDVILWLTEQSKRPQHLN